MAENDIQVDAHSVEVLTAALEGAAEEIVRRIFRLHSELSPINDVNEKSHKRKLDQFEDAVDKLLQLVGARILLDETPDPDRYTDALKLAEAVITLRVEKLRASVQAETRQTVKDKIWDQFIVSSLLLDRVITGILDETEHVDLPGNPEGPDGSDVDKDTNPLTL